MAMVHCQNKKDPGIGGHISTYSSAVTLFEVGFNHFFRARYGDQPGDFVYFQGHASPGVYARAFLEGRLNEEHLQNFRHELRGSPGLSSYPHPWLMPSFWQFPTVSMGLAPIHAIYQARFMRYLESRNLIVKTPRKVWAFVGDGETDEPESMGSLTLASRERLDNLIFVVNCNLQRLDGPVRGNGNIIDELEAAFHGAGWNVLKVIWGCEWDALIARDKSGLLVKRMGEVVDGERQSFAIKGGAYIRKAFFGKYPELLKLVADISDDELARLRLGGHDPQKVYNAYRRAVDHRGSPTVILARTVTEAGSMGSFMAAGTAYANYHVPMIPFFSYYSMFGFQRVGDLIWAFADARGKGFLLGGTAGRTTLAGEGLQHQDGHSLVLSSTVPTCASYDPAFVYEMAVIIQDGMRRMYQQGEDLFYYITMYNEGYAMPPIPENCGEGILRGLYKYQAAASGKASVQLFGSGPILNEALRA